MARDDDRIDRIEAQLAIQQLAIRYAIAIDSRDLDLMAEQWASDVWMGRAAGQGPDGVRRFFEPILRGFHRSIHMIVGHRIDLVDADNATGQVYCRAEHESTDAWVVQAIVYEDTYRRVDGSWGFARRLHHHWYSWPVDGTPRGPSFESWPGREQVGPPPDLPHVWPTWNRYWSEAGPEAIRRHSRFPGPSPSL